MDIESLKKYKELRNISKTPEPFSSGKIDPEKMFFVVQKHQATALHYDLRLEIDGVMPSWAVPKGPSLDPKFKRLAIQTENHPLGYRLFEGVIPEGEHGAGPVMIWDQGVYFAEQQVKQGIRERIEKKTEAQKILKEDLRKGEIKFFLQGGKVRGSFALVKTKNFGGKNSWLLVKHNDSYVKKDFEAKDYDFSEKSGMTLEQIRKKY